MSYLVTSIALFPAKDLKASVIFYENLGFKNSFDNERGPNSYAVLDYKGIKFHLYAYKRLEIPTPINTNLFVVNNINELYTEMRTEFKTKTGNYPKQTGLPRLGKPRHVRNEIRMTLTDINGNYLIFVELQDEEHKELTKLEEKFNTAEILAYSHDDPRSATKMLENIIMTNDLNNIDPYLLFQIYVLAMEMTKLLDKDLESSKYYNNALRIIDLLDESKINKQYLDIFKKR